jgi:hypothetical protein
MRKLLYFIPVVGVVPSIYDISKGNMKEPWYTITAFYHGLSLMSIAVYLLNYLGK